jgi:hypothetical protein
MEIILILIIIILVYLLLKKNNNKTVDGLEKKADVYGKALKNASSTFLNTLKEEKNIADENFSENQNLTKDDLDNIPEELKKGTMYVTKLMKEMYAGYLPSSDNHNASYSDEFLRDELIVGFNGMLISWSLKPFTSNASTTDKGIALGLVLFNLSSRIWKEVNDDFIRLSHNPTSQSQRGLVLANKLIDIAENINTEKWDSDSDIQKAKQNEHIIQNEIKEFNLGGNSNNTSLMMAFFLVHIGEYIEKYRLSD